MARTHIYIGTGWSQPAELLFQQQEDGETVTLAVGTVVVTAWPMYLILVVLAGTLLLITLKLIIRKKRHRATEDGRRADEFKHNQATTRSMHEAATTTANTKEAIHEPDSQKP